MKPFNEQHYLKTNPDVAAAVEAGHWPSAKMHFFATQAQQTRFAIPKVDSDFYLNAYPDAKEAIVNDRLLSAQNHYEAVGIFRGYLPFREAKRDHNAAAYRSAFGGLWTDVSNIADIIEGKYRLGKLTDEEHEQLTHWIKHGYLIIKSAIPESLLNTALSTLDRVYSGGDDRILFAIQGQKDIGRWNKAALSEPTKALDVHWYHEDIRDLIFSDRLLKFLHLIFEREALATQSLSFWRGSAQPAHQDSAYVCYSLPMQFAASWIALEDVTQDAGELFYYPGSHEFAEYLYNGRYKSAEEVLRSQEDHLLSVDYPRHISLIEAQASHSGIEKHKFLAKAGDVLIWSADLAHGGSPISTQTTRKSVVTHYCPAEVVPQYFETKGISVRKVHRGAQTSYYSSGHYSV